MCPGCGDGLLSRAFASAHLYGLTATIDFPARGARVKKIVVHFGGVTASTEVIVVKRHTGAHASVIACKNTIANQNLAYAA